MIDFIETNQQLLVATVLIAACILALFQAYFRKPERHLYLRALSIITLFSALYMLVYPPEYQMEVKSRNILHVIDASLKDKVVLDDQDHIVLYSKKYQDSSGYISHLAEISHLDPQPSQLVLYGNQFQYAELKWAIANYHVNTDSISFMSILDHFSLKHEIETGELWYLKLRFKSNIPDGMWKLYLGDELIDSAQFDRVIHNRKREHAIGQFVYQLYIYQSDSLLSIEEIPIRVRPASKYQYAIFLSSPQTEANTLKQWLAGRNNAVTAEQTITKNHKSRAGYNTKSATDFATRLKEADILMMDYQYYLQLSAADKSGLISAVEAGKALVVWPDELFFLQSQIWGEPIRWTDEAKEDERRWAYKKSNAATWHFENQQANYIKKGVGIIAVPKFKYTYDWKYSGDSVTYDTYWKKLLQPLHRKLSADNLWHNAIYNHSVSKIYNLSGGTNPHTATVLHPESSLSVIWHVATETTHANQYFAYTYSDTLNHLTREFYHSLQTGISLSKLLSQNKKANSTIHFEKKSVSKWLILLIILLALSYLWLEEKW